MKDKLVTLVGGGGFLGRYIAQALLQRGARVRVAQRDPQSALFIKPQGGLGQTQFVAADIRKPESIARAVSGADAVINLVGVLGGDFDALHVAGARTVAIAAAAAGVGALLHVSAIGADPASASSYGRSKGEGEAAVRAAFPAATILRPSIVFGREDQFTNRFAAMIAAMPMVPVVRPGAKFQPVYVGDVANAAVAAIADADTHGGKTYELGGPDILTMAQIIRWIAGAIDRSPMIVDLPDGVAAGIARLGFLPGAPITWDHWLMLQTDNIVTVGAHGIDALGIAAPEPLAAVAPGWLGRFRRNGRFNTAVAA